MKSSTKYGLLLAVSILLLSLSCGRPMAKSSGPGTYDSPNLEDAMKQQESKEAPTPPKKKK